MNTPGKLIVALKRVPSRWEAMSTAMGHLSSHKLQTALTMLGMVFGVGAVIAMLSIGAGGERKVLASIGRLGIRNVIVKAKTLRNDERPEVRKKSLGVSLRDAEAIQEAVPGVQTVLPRIEVKAWQITSDSGKTTAKVIGLSPKLRDVAEVSLSDGRFFDPLDETGYSQVCIISDQVRRKLFGFGPVLGKVLKVNDVWLEVVGVIGGQPAVGTAPASGGSTSEIWIPAATALRKFDRDPLDAPVDELVVRMRDGISTRAAASVIKPLLDRLHGGADDYEIVVPEALLDQSRETQRIFNIVMVSIAGISLLVGGIGIMNIMLASVMERTREIGIRRAIGAKKDDIRIQFVTESFLISLIGGLSGIAIGVLLARLVAAYAGWPTVITLWSLAISTGVSMAVGLVSGIYPASRAANLDPIEALRYE